MAAHQKKMDAHIAQIAQQVNPRGNVNAISAMGEGLVSSSFWRNWGKEERREPELYWGD